MHSLMRSLILFANLANTSPWDGYTGFCLKVYCLRQGTMYHIHKTATDMTSCLRGHTLIRYADIFFNFQPSLPLNTRLNNKMIAIEQ